MSSDTNLKVNRRVSNFDTSMLATHSLCECSTMFTGLITDQLPSASPSPAMASFSPLRSCGARTLMRTVCSNSTFLLICSGREATQSVNAELYR